MAGRNTNYAIGGINAANTSVQKKLTEESKRAINWLISKGTDLTEVSFKNMGVETKINNRFHGK